MITIAKSQCKFSKMNSKSLLNKVASGNLNKEDAKRAASVLERRFPTPKSK